MFKILKVFKVADFQSQQLVQESISKLNVCVRRCDGATISSCYLVLLLARLKIDFMQTRGIQTRDLSKKTVRRSTTRTTARCLTAEGASN